MICRHIAGQCQKVDPIHTRRVTPKFKLPASTRNNANFGAAEGSGQSTYRWGLGVALSSQIGTNGIDGLEILSEDGGLVFGRGWRDGAGGGREDVLIVFTASEHRRRLPSIALPTNTPSRMSSTAPGRYARLSLCEIAGGPLWCSRIPAASC